MSKKQEQALLQYVFENGEYIRRSSLITEDDKDFIILVLAKEYIFYDWLKEVKHKEPKPTKFELTKIEVFVDEGFKEEMKDGNQLRFEVLDEFFAYVYIKEDFNNDFLRKYKHIFSLKRNREYIPKSYIYGYILDEISEQDMRKYFGTFIIEE